MESIKCWVPLPNRSHCSINMKTFLILLLAAAVASAAKTHTKRATHAASLNGYIDLVVEQLQPFITNNDLDPLSLPNVTQSFSVKPLLITYSGRLSLFGGLLSDLASLRRFGDVLLTYDGRVLCLDANIGVDLLNVGYTYQAKLVGITANGNVAAVVNTVDLDMNINADMNTYTLSLENFSINGVGSTTVKLSGNSITDWLANAIIKIVVPIIKDDVVSTIDSEMTTVIENSLANANAWLNSTRG